MKMNQPKLSTEYVRSLFEYNRKTGELLWKICRGRRAKIGQPAGWDNKGRYRTTRFDGKVFLNHRLVWLWHGNSLDDVIIDHINGDRCDNRIENLRRATASQNQFNHPRKSTNTSGAKGVSWSKRLKKWYVRVYANGRVYALGWYEDLDLAELVAVEGRNKYHGAFARHQ